MRQPPLGAPPLFREIEHTADRGVVVEAAGAAELFEKAALALFATMVSPVGIEVREARRVSVTAPEWPELLQRWLSELLVLFGTEGLVGVEVVVEAIAPDAVSGVVRGEKFDGARHEFYSEIKAITYHELAVTRVDAGWQARVIFDV
jgi:SHS2 domain-containing protein